MSASIQGLHNQEWLSKICRRFKLTPLGAFLLMATINLLVDYPLGSYFRVFWPTGQIPKGLLGEPADWLYDFLIHPMILAYFVWLQSAGQKLFSELAEKNVVSPARLQTVVTQLRDRMQSRWVWIIGAVSSLLFVTWFTLAFAPALPLSPYDVAPYDSWLIKDPIIALVRAPVIFVVFYALAVVVYDLVFIIVAINAAFRDAEIQIEPMNPDGAGGLGFVGRFAVNLGYLTAALGLLLFARIMGNSTVIEDSSASLVLNDMRNFVFLFGVGAYLIIAPTIFFLPLRTAHSAMARYKNVLLGKISGRFSHLVEEVRATSWENEAQTEELLQQIRQVRDAQETIRKEVPVWPFNAVSFRRFLGFLFTPLLAAIISAIVNLIFSL